MIYAQYDMIKSLQGTMAEQALFWGQAWKNNPFMSPMGAGFELTQRIFKDYAKPEWKLEEYGIFQETLLMSDFCNLVRFSKNKKKSSSHTLFIVAPLSGHYATLLRDTVKQCTEDFDVVVTDWKNARDVPLDKGPFHLEDYVFLVEKFTKFLMKKNKATHIFAVCQPVVPVLAAISRMSKRQEKIPQSIILMGGPVDARQSPTKPNNLATQQSYKWFRDNLIDKVPQGFSGKGRQVYPGFLQHFGFMALNPERHAQSYWNFYENLLSGDEDGAKKHREFYDEYNAVLDLPAEYYLDTIKIVFQDFSLAKGTWVIDGEPVNLQDIKNAKLLVIEGARDDIAGQGQTKAAIKLCTGIAPSEKKYFLDPKAGHYALFSGSRWREHVYKVMKKFCISSLDETGLK